MNSSELDESGQQFLIQLFEQTGGEPSAQVSMYDIGEGLGLDRDHPGMPALAQRDPGRAWERRQLGASQSAVEGIKNIRRQMSEGRGQMTEIR
jgi:hypothetical protein